MSLSIVVEGLIVRVTLLLIMSLLKPFIARGIKNTICGARCVGAILQLFHINAVSNKKITFFHMWTHSEQTKNHRRIYHVWASGSFTHRRYHSIAQHLSQSSSYFYWIALMIVACRQRAQNVAKLVKLEYQENRQAVYVDDLARVGAFTICALVSFS